MDATTANSSLLIGGIFVDKGLIDQEQLERALQLQSESGERLGEILVSQFGVARLDLASALAEQWAVLERESKAGAEPGAATLVDSVETTSALGSPHALAHAPAEQALERLRARLDALEERLAEPASVSAATELAVEHVARLDNRIAGLEARLHAAEAAAAAPAASATGPRDAESQVALWAEVEALVGRIATQEAALASRVGLEDPLPRLETIEAALQERQRDGRRLEALGEALSARLAAAEARLAARTDPAELHRDLALRVGSVRAELDVLCRQVAELRVALSEQSSRAGADAVAPGTRVAEQALGRVDELASMIEEKEAAAIDERELLRDELGRSVVALEARLERIEVALAAEPRAVREGAGETARKALRPRKAGQRTTVQAPEATSVLVLAPLAEGYRLVELVRETPDVGDTVTIPEHAGEFAVTRVGRSPIPFDPRPCAYLERR